MYKYCGNVCIFEFVSECMDVDLGLYICRYFCVCLGVSMFVHKHVRMFVYLYVCLFMSVSMCAFVCENAYLCM